MKTQFKTIDEYIETFPEDVQVILQKVRRTIHEAAPEATEAISYQMPTFKLNGRNLVHFAAWQDHVSLYPVPSGTESFSKKLSPYIKGKGTLQFPLNEPVPYGLISEIAVFRANETAAKKGQNRTGYKSRARVSQ